MVGDAIGFTKVAIWGHWKRWGLFRIPRGLPRVPRVYDEYISRRLITTGAGGVGQAFP